MSAQAKASPIAKVAVVEEVGANLIGHASWLTLTSKWLVDHLANKDPGFP